MQIIVRKQGGNCFYGRGVGFSLFLLNFAKVRADARNSQNVIDNEQNKADKALDLLGLQNSRADGDSQISKRDRHEELDQENKDKCQ